MSEKSSHADQIASLRALFGRLRVEGPNTPAGQALSRQIVAELHALSATDN